MLFEIVYNKCIICFKIECHNYYDLIAIKC